MQLEMGWVNPISKIWSMHTQPVLHCYSISVGISQNHLEWLEEDCGQKLTGLFGSRHLEIWLMIVLGHSLRSEQLGQLSCLTSVFGFVRFWFWFERSCFWTSHYINRNKSLGVWIYRCVRISIGLSASKGKCWSTIGEGERTLSHQCSRVCNTGSLIRWQLLRRDHRPRVIVASFVGKMPAFCVQLAPFGATVNAVVLWPVKPQLLRQCQPKLVGQKSWNRTWTWTWLRP